MANIKVVAEKTMFLYFGDYPETSTFFDIDDFSYYTGAAYADLLGQEYRVKYAEMKNSGEVNTVMFSHDWQQVAIAKRQKDDNGFYVELGQPIMSFPFDERDCGIQNVFPEKGFKKELIRSTMNDQWVDEFMPLSKDVYWALLDKKIYMSTNIGEPPSSVKVFYIPAVSDELDIPDSRIWAVTQNTIQTMRGAAANRLVKETADQNSNLLPITDADRNLIK